MSKFLDSVTIHVKGGDGGSGCQAFRREKFVPRGGPSGGDGGHGGEVRFEASGQVNTLLHLRYNPLHRAERGEHGMGSLKDGRDGEDHVVKVPVGTQVLDPESREILADLDRDGATFVAAKGGRGGFGNAHFKSSTNRAPRRHDPGRPGEERDLLLELKLLADVGLLGFPNAGKSTLLSRISKARPKVADYPFTTLIPHLGVVPTGSYTSLVFADIPGIIEGASEGRGLGHRFLKHLERCRVLLHIVEPYPADPGPVWRVKVLRRELRRASRKLASTPEILVLSKCDTLPEDAEAAAFLEDLEKLAEKRGSPLLRISAVTGKGLPELVAAVAARIAPPAGEPS